MLLQGLFLNLPFLWCLMDMTLWAGRVNLSLLQCRCWGQVFWDVMLCHWVSGSWYLEGTIFSPLLNVGILSSSNSVTSQKTEVFSNSLWELQISRNRHCYLIPLWRRIRMEDSVESDLEEHWITSALLVSLIEHFDSSCCFYHHLQILL